MKACRNDLLAKDADRNERYARCTSCSEICQSRLNTLASALDVQVAGNHYKDMVIQPAEFIVKNGLGFLEGNVVKYVSRHKRKNKADDIKKAIHCLQLLLEIEYDETS